LLARPITAIPPDEEYGAAPTMADYEEKGSIDVKDIRHPSSGYGSCGGRRLGSFFSYLEVHLLDDLG
jgi:hypothetical protein